MKNQYRDLKCHNLSLRLGEKTLFQSFDFIFSGPGIVLIEGENGVGKSTLLKVLAGFILVDTGNISFSGHAPFEIGTKDFSYFTTTSLGLLNDLSGREHIELISKSMKLDTKMVLAKISEYQEADIFNEILIKKVGNFSQGMKQLLRLFLHLFFGPKVLFLDEPFLYLSPKLKEFIQAKLELMSFDSLILITDQKFTWEPKAKHEKIILGTR